MWLSLRYISFTRINIIAFFFFFLLSCDSLSLRFHLTQPWFEVKFLLHHFIRKERRAYRHGMTVSHGPRNLSLIRMTHISILGLGKNNNNNTRNVHGRRNKNFVLWSCLYFLLFCRGNKNHPALPFIGMFAFLIKFIFCYQKDRLLYHTHTHILTYIISYSHFCAYLHLS